MKNKVALVTGGSRGIGFAIAKAFVQEGAKVVVNYLEDEQEAKNALEELGVDEQQAIAVQADVTIKSDRKRLLDAALAQFKKIDVLVNNAAITGRHGFLKTSEEEFDAVFGCNLKAPIFLAQIVAKQMIEQGNGGSIINISSSAAHRIGGGGCYGIAKSGLEMATRSMAFKLAQYNIRANTITPSNIKTDMSRRIWEGEPEKWARFEKTWPMGRAGMPDEIAPAAVYFASDRSSYTTGANLVVDGGFILGKK